MPTTYAHYRFGQQIKEMLTGKPKEIISAYPELFDVGLHGPDLLFYYNALQKNEVNTLGSRLHELPGRYFFENAAKVLQDGGSRAHYAYVYGFLCHFVLDVYCHGYIQEKIDASGISHAEIEAEMDRELLVMDGFDPVSKILSGHIQPASCNAEVIQAFFPNISETMIEKCMKDMVCYLNLLVLPVKWKRRLILWLLKIVGHYESMHGLIINFKKNPQCADSTAKLLTLYEEARPMAVKLIMEYEEYVQGTKELNKLYQYNFSSIKAESEDTNGEI